jgi:hypothetical protein
MPIGKSEAREERRTGLFFVLIFLCFRDTVHYLVSMINSSWRSNCRTTFILWESEQSREMLCSTLPNSIILFLHLPLCSKRLYLVVSSLLNFPSATDFTKVHELCVCLPFSVLSVLTNFGFNSLLDCCREFHQGGRLGFVGETPGTEAKLLHSLE